MQKLNRTNKKHSKLLQQQQQKRAIGTESDFQFKMICRAISAIKLFIHCWSIQQSMNVYF